MESNFFFLQELNRNDLYYRGKTLLTPLSNSIIKNEEMKIYLFITSFSPNKNPDQHKIQIYVILYFHVSNLFSHFRDHGSCQCIV